MASPDQPSEQDDDLFYCATHPTVQTALRCSRCEKPICPRCMVQTPVGARCRDCGIAPKSPLERFTPVIYLRMAAVAIGAGLPIGGVWAFAAPGILGFFSFVVAAGVGYLFGQAIGWASGWRRGLTVQLFAVAGILIAYGMRSVFIYDELFLDIFGLIALSVACFVAIQNLK
jgi:hypothetical protein